MAGDRDASLLVGITDLRRHLGERREVKRTVHLAELRLADTVVDEGRDIDLDLELESISGGITATGTIHTTWESTCRRCLDPVSGELDQEVDELFSAEPVEGETYPLGHDTIDLEPLVRETVLLSLPPAPLCRPDCPGPDPDAFPVTVEVDDEDGEGATAEERPKDPRWAALDQLRDEFEE